MADTEKKSASSREVPYKGDAERGSDSVDLNKNITARSAYFYCHRGRVLATYSFLVQDKEPPDWYPEDSALERCRAVREGERHDRHI